MSFLHSSIGYPKHNKLSTMVALLHVVFCLLVGLVQVSQAVHFTNSKWEVYENQTVTFEWSYDAEDNPDPDEYSICIWLPFGNGVFPWSDNYSHLLFNSTSPLYPLSWWATTLSWQIRAKVSYDKDVTSFTWTFDCGFNLTTSEKYSFSIGGSQWGVLVSIDDSDAWTLQVSPFSSLSGLSACFVTITQRLTCGLGGNRLEVLLVTQQRMTTHSVSVPRLGSA